MASDPYKYFRIEAHDLVDQLGKGLLDLEKRGDAELVARLLRLAHTLKGAARIVKHRELADLAHAVEDALAPLRDHPVPQRADAAFALVDRMAAQVASLPAPQGGTAAQPPSAAPAPVDTAPTLPRADASAIDEVLGGLAEAHALLGRLRADRDPATVAQRIEHLDRELGNVRHDVERLRLLPASSVFTSLERTARDSALAAGKRVEFSGKNGEVRLDAHVLSVLHGALVQLVRNAVAHGIEAPAGRGSAGKAVEGRVEISFELRGGRVVVTCSDDGRGIDVGAVRRAMTARGVAGVKQMSDDELLRLLLRGGITTATEVSEHAGRGIGLDVVHEAAREVGGEVTARTTAGVGTTITISTPASLAAVAVLAVEAGGQVAAIPHAAIRRVLHLASDTVTLTSEGSCVAYESTTIPFALLGPLLGARGEPGRAMVVLDGGGGLIALGVDRTLGIEESVVRALASEVPVDPIVWGIALDAEGHPRAVLDPIALAAAARRAPVELGPAVARALPILVVDDSLTTRMLEQSILESAGYAVEVATSGEEALERLSRNSYALLLVDVEMPGMDGFTLIAELRSRRELAGIPAILVTSRNAPEDRRRGVTVGAQGYVVKSDFDQVALLAMIDRLVHT